MSLILIGVLENNITLYYFSLHKSNLTQGFMATTKIIDLNTKFVKHG